MSVPGLRTLSRRKYENNEYTLKKDLYGNVGDTVRKRRLEWMQRKKKYDLN